jgi:hypothetical protein
VASDSRKQQLEIMGTATVRLRDIQKFVIAMQSPVSLAGFSFVLRGVIG